MEVKWMMLLGTDNGSKADDVATDGRLTMELQKMSLGTAD